ncbi:hypothetical protein FZEAL_2415 [Fusarium zealandicum]|uniref:Arabinogalactan endo-beta-1,4-galactanase n=1 Tax=Fusarium zealandicum TaxID=1053134 RepID=A0A8H4URG8_9HYPO|nr:hypothetical protein FZEAL_2415 [Fusarium zealandicum]
MASLDAEMWAWYGLTMLVVLARMTSRRMLLGSFKGLLIDDYLMVLTMVTYTVLLVIVQVLTFTPTNLIKPDEKNILTTDEISKRVFGSKLVLVAEHMQMLTIWGVKGCLLFMYGRLTMSLRQNHLVKIIAGYVIVGFVVMQILWFTAWCRPFHHYWQVPPEDLNCSAETNHMITNAVINISSDIMIIALPMPVFIQSQLPIKRKVVLCAVFALGTFTILAAALSKYYSLGDPYGNKWIYWYIREVSTAIITANLPLTWTLLQRMFRLGSFHAKYGRSSGQRTGEATSRFRSAYGNLSSVTRDERRTRRGAPLEPGLSISESQEQINSSDSIILKIYQKNEVNITSDEVVPDGQRGSSPQSTHNGLERTTFGGTNGQGGRLSGDKSSNEVELGVVTKVYHGVHPAKYRKLALHSSQDIVCFLADRMILPRPLVILSFCSVALSALTYRGVDWSSLLVEEAEGIKYTDGGAAKPLEDILVANGVNSVRQRVWVNPSNGDYNLDYNLKLAKRAKAAGMSVYLTLHFSDTWADPAHQGIPSGWPTDIDALSWRLYNYTLDVSNAFQSAGVAPAIISIGNEITAGLLLPTGSTKSFYNIGRLLNSAAYGIKDSRLSPKPKIMVHLDRGWDWGTQEYFYTQVLGSGEFSLSEFDIMGVSYYPFYGSGASFSALESSLGKMAAKWGKEIIVCELDWPTKCPSPSEAFPADMKGIPFSAQGQSEFIKKVANIVSKVDGGTGLYYWEPAWMNNQALGSSCESNTLFSWPGEALSSLSVFGNGKIDGEPKLKDQAEPVLVVARERKLIFGSVNDMPDQALPGVTYVDANDSRAAAGKANLDDFAADQVARHDSGYIGHGDSPTQALPSVGEAPEAADRPCSASNMAVEASSFSHLPAFIKPPSVSTAGYVSFLQSQKVFDLPHVALQCELVKSFVELIYPRSPLLNLQSFLNCVNSPDGLNGQVSLALYSAILFAGSTHAELDTIRAHGYPQRENLRKELYRRVELLFELDTKQDMLILVQVALLMASRGVAEDDRKDSWHWVNTAISAAYTINLHRDRSTQALTLNEQRLRRRVWWCCYVRDSILSLGTHRPTRIKEQDFDVPMLEIADLEFDLLTRRHVLLRFGSVGPFDPAKELESAELCLQKTKLSVLINQIQQYQATATLQGDSGPLVSSNGMMSRDGISNLDSALGSWKRSLPRSCCYRPLAEQEHGGLEIMPVDVRRHLLHMAYYAALYTLHRPRLLPDSPRNPAAKNPSQDQEASRAMVTNSVNNITRLAAELHQHNMDCNLPIAAITMLCPAISMHLAHMKSQSQSVRDTAAYDFRVCMKIMGRMQQLYSTTEITVKSLESALRKASVDYVRGPGPRDEFPLTKDGNDTLAILNEALCPRSSPGTTSDRPDAMSISSARHDYQSDETEPTRNNDLILNTGASDDMASGLWLSPDAGNEPNLGQAWDNWTAGNSQDWPLGINDFEISTLSPFGLPDFDTAFSSL